MNFWKFSLATITGSAIWCSVLAYLGAKAYQVQPDLISDVDGWSDFYQSPVALDRAFSPLLWRFRICWCCG